MATAKFFSDTMKSVSEEIKSLWTSAKEFIKSHYPTFKAKVQTWSNKMNEQSNLGRLAITTAALAFVGIVLFFVNMLTEQDYVRIHMIWFWASLIYIGASWRFSEQVQAGFTAVLQRFGKNVDTLEPGLHFAPLWVYKLRLVDMQIKQNELPDEPENIWLGEVDDIPPGKKPALRIAFRDSITEKEAKIIFGTLFTTKGGIDFRADVPNDGLAMRVTAPVTPVIEYVVKEPQLFVARFADVSELKRVIEDEVFRVLNMLLPNMSIAQALANKAWINAHLIETIENRITRDGAQGANWGVDVQGAYIKNLPLHHGLNKAIGAASEAKFQGQANKELTIRQGEGTAQAAHDLEAETLKGRAEGMKAYMEKTKLSAEQIQAAEVARAIAEGGNAVIVGADGFGQLLGVVSATLGKNGQKPDQKGNP